MVCSKGFTLIELLIVVAIIGILAAIAVPNFLNAQVRANVARVQGDFKAISTAMEMYRIENNSYPGDHDLDTAIFGQQTGLFKLTFPVSYMNSVPYDPFIVKIFKGMSVFNRDAVNGYSDNYIPAYEVGSGADNADSIRRQAYSMLSYGPDNRVDLFTHDNFPFGIKFHPYSPSNGTKSNGDIEYRDGDWHSGCLMLNEWEPNPQWSGSGCR